MIGQGDPQSAPSLRLSAIAEMFKGASHEPIPIAGVCIAKSPLIVSLEAVIVPEIIHYEILTPSNVLWGSAIPHRQEMLSR